ncbi:hypothetical protein EXIGLDRAFT_844210 [Exidia glandulosa HHB12029]|uniref:C2H2-type domain-containing protein n=1 Tax=Exidia glandulosa HHB12029 TaxID=1314781 RepID=A0A165C687_EXIGL|nr:hypothetical protein EXIGLDRAFT_844210 [Exidia glandulosa HHB12029]
MASTSTETAPAAANTPGSQLYTCLSCSIAFHTAEEQRLHYRSDHHRYNMKRRVAGLPPVSAHAFDEKVLERRAETALTVSAKGMTCDVCRKVYTTENAYRSHINSKRHKENEAKPQPPPPPSTSDVAAASVSTPTPAPAPSLDIAEDASDEVIAATIDARIAAARAHLLPTACIFCTHTSSSTLAQNLEHMHTAHGFFVPDAEYLVDVPGLHAFLAAKVAVAHACVWCAKEFRSLDAVRKHMLDKGHTKVPYQTEKDRLEISDFYDFSSSYPDAEEHRRKRAERREAKKAKQAEGAEWEDVDDEDEADEVVDAEAMPPASDSSDDDSDDDEELPATQATYGDTPYELVLPNGSRLGHRSLARYYKQRFSPVAPSSASTDPNSGAALVRRLLQDKNSALVPARGGGYGAFGSGTEVVKARNRGEAREAGRHVREHRDQRRREEFRTRVGFIHNSQKHYRDPLLQVAFGDDPACMPYV